MWKARFAGNQLDGATGKVVSDASGLATALATIPVLKPEASVVSGGLFVYKALNEAVGSLLPWEFDNSATDFSFADNQTVYNEDDTGGYWEKLKVTARSKGWKMDTFLLKAILKMAKFKDLGGLTLPESLTEFESNLAKYAISEGTKTVINEATGGSRGIEVCSGRWRTSTSPTSCTAKPRSRSAPRSNWWITPSSRPGKSGSRRYGWEPNRARTSSAALPPRSSRSRSR